MASEHDRKGTDGKGVDDGMSGAPITSETIVGELMACQYAAPICPMAEPKPKEEYYRA